MEFSLICPTDGRVDLSLEDITAVVFRGAESVEIVFECPHCGTSLRAQLQVPNLLAAASEIARHFESVQAANAGNPAADAMNGRAHPHPHEGTADPAEGAEVRSARETAGEPYCEYFRRQLASVECVEDVLAEIDAQRR